VDAVEVDGRQVGSPSRHRLLEEDLQRLEAELPHPVGLALQVGDFFNKLAGETLARLEYVLLRIAEPVAVFLIDIDHRLCHPCFPLSVQRFIPIISNPPSGASGPLCEAPASLESQVVV